MEFTDQTQSTTEREELSIDVRSLTFAYPGHPSVLKDFNMQLAGGARCLLVGANGSGKSTILRILAGRHLTKPDGAVMVLGRDSFHSTSLNFERAYLDTDWGMRTVAFAGYGCPLQADIPVHGMMTKLQEEYPERRAELLELLGIDPNWRMHMVSDGQRRRVQIFIALLRPFKILLLDEVTVSLDVIVRMDLMQYLKKETETRLCTVVYATHIFDGLDDWPTHVHYLNNHGATGWQGRLEDLEVFQARRQAGDPSPMLRVAELWLRAEMLEKKEKCEREKEDGSAALEAANPLQASYVSGGGFSAGRMSAYDTIG